MLHSVKSELMCVLSHQYNRNENFKSVLSVMSFRINWDILNYSMSFTNISLKYDDKVKNSGKNVRIL